jgi:hypothetical protein
MPGAQGGALRVLALIGPIPIPGYRWGGYR